jgi:hypothetical protein
MHPLGRAERLRWAAAFGRDRVATGRVWWSKRFRAQVASLTSENHKPLTRAFTAERVGQRLNQDAWDQVRQLIKNLR